MRAASRPRPPHSVDLFAGGGGASEGIRMAFGRAPALAINHDPVAIVMHAANHKTTIHMCEDLYKVAPFRPRGRPIDLLWASPDCCHFSRAKGGKPLSNKRRGLAGVVVEWARAVHPKVICLENVVEWLDAGPLYPDDHADPKLRCRPIPERKGDTFREWVASLELAGYRVAWRVLCAADYGAPTSRRRLFLVARCDGKPIRWPEPTHGPGRALPWRTAAEIIDWMIPALSIFATAAEAKVWAATVGADGVPVRPLAEATLRRIAEGVRRYVLNAPRPFIVQTSHTSSDGGKVRPVDAPLSTVVTKAEHCLIVPTLVQSGYGEREGQAPRILDLQAPLGTVVAGGSKHALVSALLSKFYGNGVIGQSLDRPIGTVTAVDHHGLVAAHLTQFYGTSTGAPLDRPAPTVADGSGQGHTGLVAALLCKWYGSDKHGQSIDEPLHTIPTVDRFGVVTVDVDGETYAITDISLRMLQPRELANAQGFGPDYVLTGSKREQVARIGNSVNPQLARAVAGAQFDGFTGDTTAAA